MMNRVPPTPRGDVTISLVSRLLLRCLAVVLVLVASVGAFSPYHNGNQKQQQQALSLLLTPSTNPTAFMRIRPSSLVVVSVQGTAQDPLGLEETIHEHGRRFMDLFRFQNGSPVVVKEAPKQVPAAVVVPSSGMGLVRGTSTNNNNAGRRGEEQQGAISNTKVREEITSTSWQTTGAKLHTDTISAPAPAPTKHQNTTPSPKTTLDDHPVKHANGLPSKDLGTTVAAATSTTTIRNGASSRYNHNINNAPASLPDLLPPSSHKKKVKPIPRINLNDLNDVRLLKQQRQLELGNRPTFSKSSTGRFHRKRPGNASLLQQTYTSNVPPPPSSNSEQVLQAIKREKAQIQTNYERLLSGAGDNSYVRWKNLGHDNHHFGNNILPPFLPTFTRAKKRGTIYQQLKRTRSTSESPSSSSSSSSSSAAAAAAAAAEEPSNHHDIKDPKRWDWNFPFFHRNKNIPPSSSFHPVNPLVSTESSSVQAQAQAQPPPLQLLHPRLHNDIHQDAFQHQHQQLISSHRIREQQLLQAQQQAHLEAERHAQLEQQHAVEAGQELAERHGRRMAPFQRLLRVVLRKPSSTVDRDHDD